MNHKTIIGFGFRIISRIMEISEISAKSASADNTLLDLHNSLDDAQPHPIIVKSYRNCSCHIASWTCKVSNQSLQGEHETKGARKVSNVYSKNWINIAKLRIIRTFVSRY